jgi:phage repressor protein C with HTH and peptisase S24 domain
MLPLYRNGDIVIVSPTVDCRKGDRIVLRTHDGEVMAKILERKTQRSVELRSLNPDHKNRVLPVSEIDWMARIIWASQ